MCEIPPLRSQARCGRDDRTGIRPHQSSRTPPHACFQAAIAGLIRARIAPASGAGSWDHAVVHARFVGDLINRRKEYAADLRDTLSVTIRLRHKADYQYDSVTADQAVRAVRRAVRFVEEIESKEGA